MKSIRTAARQLELLRSTVHKVLHKNLRLYTYNVQMLQALQPNDMPRQKEFAVNMLHEFLRMKHSSSEFVLVMRQLFYVSGKLNKHIVRIWGSVRSKKGLKI